MTKQPFTEQSPLTSGIPHPQKDLCANCGGTTTTMTTSKDDGEDRQEEAENHPMDHRKEAVGEEERRRLAQADCRNTPIPLLRNS